MAMKLDGVVPFGRSWDEYVQMFQLTETDLQKSILGVGDGPASFNAEGTKLGYNIKSIDPLYKFTAKEIKTRFDQVVDNIIEQIKQTPQDWVWTYHGSLEGLRKNRERAIDNFCQDYEQGKLEQRYEIGELPKLQYRDRQFQLGLCSHFLFLYSQQFDVNFHLQGIREMLRVCEQVRIFPLLTLMLERSPHLEPVIQQLTRDGYNCEIIPVPYELQRGGNEMLKITSPDAE
ncbi:hypothetical protein [Calothrix sp. 336/3]|uniref:hypothetical protein n=1 Tax=Calothrix sp. 336/3 TaxID=1337936 RepID=UPI0004E2E0C2|nr:hypothetical protein [Calothrix sp. 336/3]AKG24087.1 SAM-dependent methyltransferase [Calothrix sp. 336/3]